MAFLAILKPEDLLLLSSAAPGATLALLTQACLRKQQSASHFALATELLTQLTSHAISKPSVSTT